MIVAIITFMFTMWLDKIMIGHSHDHEYEISFVAEPKKHDDQGRGGVELRTPSEEAPDSENLPS